MMKRNKLSDRLLTELQSQTPEPSVPATIETNDLPGKQPPEEAEPAQRPRIPAVDIANESVDTALTKSLRYKSINPSRCKPWKYHDRTLVETWLTSEACGTLAESIRNDGQQQLGLVRPIHDDPDFDYEIVFGLRRCFACSLAGVQFQARVTEASDAECIRLMVVENAESEDISEIERALSCRRQAEAEIFKTHHELADAHGISRGLLSRRIKAAGIYDYPEIVEAFGPLLVGLSVRAAADLMDAIGQGDDARKRILAKAKQLAAVGIPLPPAESFRDTRRESARLAEQLVRQILKRDAATPSEREQRVYAQVGRSKLVSANFLGNGTVAMTVNTRSKVPTDELKTALDKAVSDILAHARIHNGN